MAQERVSIIVFSGELDKCLAAFIIGTGAAASGMEVDMFFTFWGLSVLRKKGVKVKGKSFIEKMFGMMLPKGADNLALSKMHMLGMGTNMMKEVMKKKKVASLPELIEIAKQLGVNLYACEMSMNVLGLKREELIDGLKGVVGVATYLENASKAQITLFI
ncbi:MAG: DsrE/DsrF/DrsH-like family protein [candidate division WOR-3 bacterium]|nr:DsrE/DsrF/DrsH-like family protein [candidate division WOR-3 bacterium]